MKIDRTSSPTRVTEVKYCQPGTGPKPHCVKILTSLQALVKRLSNE